MGRGNIFKPVKIQVTGVSIRFINPIIATVRLMPNDVFPSKIDIRLNASPHIIVPNIAIEWKKMRIDEMWRDELVLYDNGICIEKIRVTYGKDESIDWQFSRAVYADKQ